MKTENPRKTFTMFLDVLDKGYSTQVFFSDIQFELRTTDLEDGEEIIQVNLNQFDFLCDYSRGVM